MESHSARLCHFSYLRRLRLPPDATPPPWEIPGGCLLLDGPQYGPEVVGVIEFQGIDALSLRSIGVRIPGAYLSLCAIVAAARTHYPPRRNFPKHISRADISQTNAPCGELFQMRRNKNINRILRVDLARIGVPGAGRYSKHCFRRGPKWPLFARGPLYPESCARQGGLPVDFGSTWTYYARKNDRRDRFSRWTHPLHRLRVINNLSRYLYSSTKTTPC